MIVVFGGTLNPALSISVYLLNSMNLLCCDHTIFAKKTVQPKSVMVLSLNLNPYSKCTI